MLILYITNVGRFWFFRQRGSGFRIKFKFKFIPPGSRCLKFNQLVPVGPFFSLPLLPLFFTSFTSRATSCSCICQTNLVINYGWINNGNFRIRWAAGPLYWQPLFFFFFFFYLTKFRIVSAILILSFRKNHFLYFEYIIFMYFNEINEKRLTIFE